MFVCQPAAAWRKTLCELLLLFYIVSVISDPDTMKSVADTPPCLYLSSEVVFPFSCNSVLVQGAYLSLFTTRLIMCNIETYIF